MKSILIVFSVFSAFASGQSLERAMLQLMAETKISGMSLVVTQKRKKLFEVHAGYADVERQIPVSSNTLFRIASISKVFVGLSVMQLVEQKKWHLDDDINDHSAVSIRNPNYPKQPITLRMLMTHTSSIEDGDILTQTHHKGGRSPVGLVSFLGDFFDQGGQWYSKKNFLNQPPGSVYNYSNVAMAVLAHLVEQVTNLDFEKYSQENLFLPLGMERTSWHLEGVNEKDVAIPYTWEKNRYEAHPHFSYPCYTSGGVRTSARQLSHLAEFLSTGSFEKKRLLRPKTLRQMKKVFDPKLSKKQALILRYRTFGERRALGHSGSNLGGRAYLFYDPKTKIAVTALMNTEPIREDLLKNFLSSLFENRWK